MIICFSLLLIFSFTFFSSCESKRNSTDTISNHNLINPLINLKLITDINSNPNHLGGHIVTFSHYTTT